MIFTKDEANEALVKAFKAKGFTPSPQTLAAAEKMYARAGEEETLEDFSADVFPALIASYGEANKLFADKLKEIKPKDPKVVEPEPQDPAPAPDANAAFLAELKAEREAMQKEREELATLKEGIISNQAKAAEAALKSSLIAESQKTYGEDIVKLSQIDFDFSRENATQLWNDKVGAIAKAQGREPLAGGEPAEKKIDTSMAKAKLEAEKAANEAAKK